MGGASLLEPFDRSTMGSTDRANHECRPTEMGGIQFKYLGFHGAIFFQSLFYRLWTSPRDLSPETELREHIRAKPSSDKTHSLISSSTMSSNSQPVSSDTVEDYGALFHLVFKNLADAVQSRLNLARENRPVTQNLLFDWARTFFLTVFCDNNPSEADLNLVVFIMSSASRDVIRRLGEGFDNSTIAEVIPNVAGPVQVLQRQLVGILEAYLLHLDNRYVVFLQEMFMRASLQQAPLPIYDHLDGIVSGFEDDTTATHQAASAAQHLNQQRTSLNARSRGPSGVQSPIRVPRSASDSPS
ncbi:hypothetical protein NMY22_g3128 [Coprinellus aureogranulatus]|nr:hypothetical protein NMY22_g3128 [Coprinellus aureogranulatus]